MDIIAHDENSLTNLLFSEIHRCELLPAFLTTIVWRNGAMFPIEVRRATLHQQVGLSGFGRPDALIIIEAADGHYHVVIVESKLTTYVEACAHNLAHRRFNPAINTKLNNQLTLRYRAMRSLRTLHAPPGHLVEQDHITHSPYSGDKVRRCKKLSTRRLLQSLPLDETTFSLVALTADTRPVFDTVVPTHHFFPLFFNQQTESHEDDFPRLGSTNWHRCNAAFAAIKNHFTPSYEALFRPAPPTPAGPLEMQAEADAEIGKRHIVEYQDKVCHLSRGASGSYRLHEWTAAGFELLDTATRDVEKYRSLRPLLRPICRAPNIEREGQDDDWRSFFEDLARRRGT